MAINTAFLDELEGKVAIAPAPQDFFAPPPSVAKKETGGINYDFLDSLEADEHEEVQENKAKMIEPPVKTFGGISEIDTSTLFAPEDPQGRFALQKPGPAAEMLGKTVGPVIDKTERAMKQFWNKGVADVIKTLGASDDPALIEGYEIQKARMAERKKAGHRKFPEKFLNDELKDIVWQLGLRPEARDDEDLKKITKVYSLGDDTKQYPLKFNIPPGQDPGDYIADTVAGIGSFVAQIYFLKKVLPSAPSQTIWEIQNIATGGKLGRGAAINTALKSISQIPTVSTVGKTTKVAAGGTLFGGLTYAEGGEWVDVATSVAIGAGFQGWDIHKQNQWLKSFKSHLRKAEYAKMQQEITKGNMNVRQAYQQDLATGMDPAKAKSKYQRALKGVTTLAGDKLEKQGKNIDKAMDIIARKLHHGKLEGREAELAKKITEKGLTPEAAAEVAKVKLPKVPKEELAKKGYPKTTERLFKPRAGKTRAEAVQVVRDAKGVVREYYPAETRFESIPKGWTVTTEAIPKQPTGAPAQPAVAKQGVKPEIPITVPPEKATPPEIVPKTEPAEAVTEVVAKEPLIVYRTEKAHPVYKGKKVWGSGKYFSLNKGTAGEMQLDPDRKVVQEWTPKTGGVDTYTIPVGTKLKTIDITKMSIAEFNALPRGEDLRKQILAEGYDGIKLLTDDDLNLGGDQVIIYKSEKWAQEALKEKEQEYDSQKKEGLVRGEPQGEEPGRPVQVEEGGRAEVAAGGVLQAQGGVEKKLRKPTTSEITEYKKLKDGFSSMKFNIDSPQMKRLIELEYIVEQKEKPVKEIKYEEAITEPATSLEMEQGKTGKPISEIEPTGQLDPTNYEDALEITQRHANWLARGGDVAVGGIFETKWEAEKGELGKGGFVVSSVEYTPKQVDTAYRTIQKPVPSPMPDTELFAMPGKETQMQAIAQKMQKVKGVSKKIRRIAKLTKPGGLPKAKTAKADHIKAVYQVTAKETTRYSINGVKVEGDTIIATDGRRMFWAKGKWGEDGLYLNPASLKNGLLGKVTKEKEGLKFPKWRDIIPDVSDQKPILIPSGRIYEDLDTVFRRVRQAQSMTTEESKGVTVIENKDGSLGFAAAAPEVGHVEININPGGKILGAVNPQFLLDAIKFHTIRGNDSFEFYFPNWERPMLTKSFDGKTFTLTMPVNIEIEKPSEAIKKAISEQVSIATTKGGTAGASVAAEGAQAGGGYGTIAPNEQSTFAEKTQPHRVRQELPSKTSINVLDELLKIASPAHRVGSREGARVLRKNLGKLSQETVVAHKTLRKIHHAFTFMNRDDVYDFIDRLENGREQLSPRLTQIAQKFRSMLDERRDAVQALGKGQLQNFYENYFPHIWKDPKVAEKAIRQIFGKRRFEGSKSFLKKRTIMTIKEGREAGLELVSENPVDLVLLKLFEMDRYLMAHHVIQDLKTRSLIKFVYSRSPSPEGYKKIDDRAFTVYMPPEITKKEAYDSIMVDQMMDIARSLGIDTQRFVSLGKGKGRWWGYASWKTKTGEKVSKVRTRYAGPEAVLAHEIGHILGINYELYDTLRRKKDGSYREITRGKKKGQPKFVPTEEAVKHRKVIDVEWRALADARIKDKATSKGFAKYVRKAREKEAVMLEALIHAPKEFKKIAPTLHDLFVKFLNAHSELRPILDIKPSLILGESEAHIKVPGFTVLGHYYAPEPVAKILNNYLSPGLRNNENILVASGYNMTRMMANVINQAQLALSGFHAINVTTDMMASTLGQGIRRLTVKGQRIRGIGDIVSTPISPILRLWNGVRLRLAYNKQIDTIESENLRNLIKAVVLADGRDRMDPFYYNRQIKALKKTFSDILKGSPVQKIKGVGKLPFNMFGATLEGLAAPLMQWYVPTGKLGLFAMLAQHEMQRAEAGQINPEQLHERLISSWDSVDNRMGQLVYDNLFWNKTLKDVAMLAVRSVGWNLGSWREYGGVPVDILGTRGRLERGDVLLSQKMAYSIGAIILYGTLGAVTMYLLTGKGPDEPKDCLFPKTGRKNPDGSDERINFPTYAKDWFAYGTQPIKTVTHKIHPLWGLLTDLATNKDFFNVEVRHPDDPISQQVLDFTKHIGKSFIPISIRNYQKMQKTAPESKEKNFWVSITGVVSAPSYITRSSAQKLMYHYIIERIPDKARTKESFEKSMYRKRLKAQIRKGEPIDEKEGKRILGKASFRRMKTDAEKVPFAESFNRLTLYEALNVYAIARPDEREQVKDILKSKYRRARNVTEDMKTMFKKLTK